MRRIVAEQRQAIGGQPAMDTYFDRVIKYIPSDIVGAWVAITGLISGAAGIPSTTVLWIMFAIMAIITLAWTLKQTAIANKPMAKTQAMISTGSFVVWVIALGGPFATLSFYRPIYGSLLLIVYTLGMSLIVPKET